MKPKKRIYLGPTNRVLVIKHSLQEIKYPNYSGMYYLKTRAKKKMKDQFKYYYRP